MSIRKIFVIAVLVLTLGSLGAIEYSVGRAVGSAEQHAADGAWFKRTCWGSTWYKQFPGPGLPSFVCPRALP